MFQRKRGNKVSCDEAMLAPFPPASPPCTGPGGEGGAPHPPQDSAAGPGGGAPPTRTTPTQGPLLPDPLLPSAGKASPTGDPGPGRGQDTTWAPNTPCSPQPSADSWGPSPSASPGSRRGTAARQGSICPHDPPKQEPMLSIVHTEKTGREQRGEWPHSQDVTVPSQARVSPGPAPPPVRRHKHPACQGPPTPPSCWGPGGPQTGRFPLLPSFPFFLSLSLSSLPSMQPFLPLIHY